MKSEKSNHIDMDKASLKKLNKSELIEMLLKLEANKKPKKVVHTHDDLTNDDPFPNFIIKNDPFERTMDKVNNKKRDIDRQSLDIDNKHQKLMSEPVQNEQKIHDYPMIKTTLGEFRKDEMKMSNDKLRHKKSLYKLF